MFLFLTLANTPFCLWLCISCLLWGGRESKVTQGQCLLCLSGTPCSFCLLWIGISQNWDFLSGSALVYSSGSDGSGGQPPSKAPRDWEPQIHAYSSLGHSKPRTFLGSAISPAYLWHLHPLARRPTSLGPQSPLLANAGGVGSLVGSLYVQLCCDLTARDGFKCQEIPSLLGSNYGAPRFNKFTHL